MNHMEGITKLSLRSKQHSSSLGIKETCQEQD